MENDGQGIRQVGVPLIPEFAFRGSDFNSLWATITTYEGESLFIIAKDGDEDQSESCSRRGGVAWGCGHEELRVAGEARFSGWIWKGVDSGRI